MIYLINIIAGDTFQDTSEVKPDKEYFNDVTNDTNSSLNEKRSPSLIIPDYSPSSLSEYTSSIIDEKNNDINKELEFDEDNESKGKEWIDFKNIPSKSNDLDNPGSLITDTTNTNPVGLGNSNNPSSNLPSVEGKSVSSNSTETGIEKKFNSALKYKQLASLKDNSVKHETDNKNIMLGDESHVACNKVPSSSISVAKEDNFMKHKDLLVNATSIHLKQPMSGTEWSQGKVTSKICVPYIRWGFHFKSGNLNPNIYMCVSFFCSGRKYSIWR